MEGVRICKVEAKVLGRMFNSGDPELKSYVSSYGWYTDQGLKASAKYAIAALVANPIMSSVTSRAIDLFMPRFPWISTQLFRMLRFHAGRNVFKRELIKFKTDEQWMRIEL